MGLAFALVSLWRMPSLVADEMGRMLLEVVADRLGGAQVRLAGKVLFQQAREGHAVALRFRQCPFLFPLFRIA